MGKPKKLKKYTSNGYIRFTLFVLATIILWIIRTNSYNNWLVDTNKKEHDQIWQLFYPFMCMPIISLIYWISEWWKKYRYLIPIIASVAGFFLYIFSSDWWEHIWETIPLSDFIPTWIPSFIAALIWIWIVRIIFAITKSFNSKNKK